MTKIKFFKNNGIYVGLECSGHTGYDESGRDIVCASVSSIVQAGIWGVIKTLSVDAYVERDDDKGYIKMELPPNLGEGILHDTQVIMCTVYDALIDLSSGYPKYISMEVIEDVY